MSSRGSCVACHDAPQGQILGRHRRMGHGQRIKRDKYDSRLPPFHFFELADASHTYLAETTPIHH